MKLAIPNINARLAEGSRKNRRDSAKRVRRFVEGDANTKLIFRAVAWLVKTNFAAVPNIPKVFRLKEMFL